MEMLHAVAEIVNDVHALKDRCRSDSGALDYACTHWVYHLSLAEWDDDLRSILTAFMGQKLQQWLVKAWCLQDFETCLRTLCEVQELYSTANTKAEHEAEKVGSARRSTKEVVNGVNTEAEQAEVARHSITETAEDVQKFSNIGASSSSLQSGAPRSAVDYLGLDAGPSSQVLGKPQAFIDTPEIASLGSGSFPFAQSCEDDTGHFCVSQFDVVESSSSTQPSEQPSYSWVIPSSITPHHHSSFPYTCLWLHDDTCCGFVTTLEGLKEHLNSAHFHGYQNTPIECRWEGCNSHRRGDPSRRAMRRDVIWRHIREIHLRFRRAQNPR